MSRTTLLARLFPVRTIERHGWRVRFLDDGYGPAGWHAYTGPEDDPDLETGLFDTAKTAALVALECWPERFGQPS